MLEIFQMDVQLRLVCLALAILARAKDPMGQALMYQEFVKTGKRNEETGKPGDKPAPR